jgi:transposase-like protein
MIHDMYLAPTREAALKAYDLFIASFGAKYPKAVECLTKDKGNQHIMMFTSCGATLLNRFSMLLRTTRAV